MLMNSGQFSWSQASGNARWCLAKVGDKNKIWAELFLVNFFGDGTRKIKSQDKMEAKIENFEKFQYDESQSHNFLLVLTPIFIKRTFFYKELTLLSGCAFSVFEKKFFHINQYPTSIRVPTVRFQKFRFTKIPVHRNPGSKKKQKIMIFWGFLGSEIYGRSGKNDF